MICVGQYYESSPKIAKFVVYVEGRPSNADIETKTLFINGTY